jgi:DNA repair exonuclease SbcCD ATPase subunit
MIRSLELTFFRKHQSLSIDFTAGLNVLRGPNEIGKTTITEGILYALYGAAALIDKLEDVVTWGQKESALRSILYITISGVDYVFSRSKGGATCGYTMDGKDYMVTGQKEVTAFAATLLGADAKTAGVLMMASQAGLRGALDEGATAVSALMGKLADFDLIDRLLNNASQTLALGSTKPVQDKLVEASQAVEAAKANLVSPETVAAIETAVAQKAAEIEVVQAEADVLVEAVNRADNARDAAASNNRSYAAAQEVVRAEESKLEQARSRLQQAQVEAAKRPDTSVLAGLRSELASAQGHSKLLAAYQAFLALPPYPEVAWDEPKESFDTGLANLVRQRDDAALLLREQTSDISSLRRTIITGDGKCPTCGHAAANHQHVLEANAAVAVKIGELEAKKPALDKIIKDAEAEITVMNNIMTVASKRQAAIDRISSHLAPDASVYPIKVSWVGEIPTTEAPNVGALTAKIDTIEKGERSALQAEGMVAAHQATITTIEAAVARANQALGLMSLTPTGPLQEAYEAAYTASSLKSAALRAFRDSLALLQGQRDAIVHTGRMAQAALENAEARVVEYAKDVETMDFNNELVKKLKSMKPMITDHLWNTVLAAVSNFFSTLRGDQSVVSKDATGFRVNGRGGSLSGSTLDMLALAIRVALSKTFVPHANFMVLDEPAHGCDENRTGNLLGFLAGVGFQQTILASHDEVSEAVADNVIQLGE